jgi:hypothetical protein
MGFHEACDLAAGLKSQFRGRLPGDLGPKYLPYVHGHKNGLFKIKNAAYAAPNVVQFRAIPGGDQFRQFRGHEPIMVI